MPFAGVAIVVLLTLVLCGIGVLVAVIGRWKRSRPLVVAGLVPVGIVFALVVLAVLEGYLPLDWQARLHMSLPPEARVVKIQSDMDKLEIVFRLPEASKSGFNPKGFQTVWKSNVGDYTHPCILTPSEQNSPEFLCSCYDGDPDGGERRLFFDAMTRTSRYSAR